MLESNQTWLAARAVLLTALTRISKLVKMKINLPYNDRRRDSSSFLLLKQMPKQNQAQKTTKMNKCWTESDVQEKTMEKMLCSEKR